MSDNMLEKNLELKQAFEETTKSAIQLININKRLHKENKKLNNIINEFENYIRARADDNDTCSVCSVMTDDLLNILKGSDKE